MKRVNWTVRDKDHVPIGSVVTIHAGLVQGIPTPLRATIESRLWASGEYLVRAYGWRFSVQLKREQFDYPVIDAQFAEPEAL